MGKSLAEISVQRERDPVSVAIEIVRKGRTRIASFNMNEQDIERFMRQPWVMSSSDGTDGHPRKYASYPRKYTEYVRGKQIISEAEFIHRSSALVADTFALDRRGYLREGYYADIVILDPNAYRPMANFKHWNRQAEGVAYILVNGKVVIDNEKYTGALAGRALQRKN